MYTGKGPPQTQPRTDHSLLNVFHKKIGSAVAEATSRGSWVKVNSIRITTPAGLLRKDWPPLSHGILKLETSLR